MSLNPPPISTSSGSTTPYFSKACFYVTTALIAAIVAICIGVICTHYYQHSLNEALGIGCGVFAATILFILLPYFLCCRKDINPPNSPVSPESSSEGNKRKSDGAAMLGRLPSTVVNILDDNSPKETSPT